MTYCENCGTELAPGAGFCAACGAEAFGERATGESQANGVSRAGDATALAAGQDGRPMLLRDRIAAAGITPGFSERMETDEFQTAMKKANRTHVIVLAATAVLLAPLLVAIVSVIKPSNVGALVGAGVIVEAIIICIIVYMLAKRFGGKSWDGQVTGKRVSRERSGNSTRRVFITEFTTDDGRKKKHKARTLHPTYDYLNVGDRVRYHPQLSYPFEKYDKTTDGLLLCPFCGDFQEIENDSCSRCKKPLLK